MNVKKLSIGVAAALALTIAVPVVSGKRAAGKPVAPVAAPAALWRNPVDLLERDLFYGPGGKEHEPHGPMTFVKEDVGGSNPKYVVKDADGVEWKVKLGLEVKPETVASRIVWAAGYYANEDYYLPELQIRKLPLKLKRGRKLFAADGTVRDVRLKREDKEWKKVGEWRWKQNPFVGSREFNGLKVMMALINNWDLKDENNAIYQQDDRRIYMVSDLGATFGPAGRTYPLDKTKGNLEEYRRARFIRGIAGGAVDFQTPARPKWVFLVGPREYLRRVHLEWIGRQIPRNDARWIGDVLSHLSKAQIRAAFRAAGYTPSEVEGFAEVLESRIIVLTDL